MNESLYEYIISILAGVFFPIIVPSSIVQFINHIVLSILRIIPFEFDQIFYANIINCFFIYIVSLFITKAPSFFIVLNGFVFGFIAAFYRENIVLFYHMMFPHALIETIAILLFCTSLKSKPYYYYSILVSFLLFFVAALLETQKILL